ncbi:arylsulfatase [Prolixibacteraceae bacterium JC049]|nr:arylsulfatase [Prolixibacteraceae bacterium JC049]
MSILKRNSIIILSIWSLFQLQACKAEKEEQAPNIIYILADDLGYGDVSCLNPQGKIQTPEMDKLAQSSMVYTDAHTNSAVCTPTRYGILTGRYSWRTELKKWVVTGYGKSLIKPQRSTLASLLKTQGYQTACIGKWHLGWDWNGVDKGKDSVDFSQPIQNGPTTVGFDYFYGFCGSLDMPPYVWVENNQPTMVPIQVAKRGTSNYAWFRNGVCSTDFDHEQALPQITERAVSYIQKKSKDEKPFFLYLPLPAPHLPIMPTEEFKGKSGLDSPYADFVIMVDWVVGEITKSLKANNISENTLIVFTSDNGCSTAANYKHLQSKGHNPSGEFRGTKADIYEGGHRVPFFVSWPAKVKSGQSSHLVSTTDFYATLADLFQVKMQDNEGEDSFSMLQSMGMTSTMPQRESMVQHSGHGMFALRKGDWKACFCPGSGGWTYPTPKDVEKMTEPIPSVQLFNLKKDIAESKNQYHKHPEKLQELRSELKQIIENGRSTKGAIQQNDGPVFWPQLKLITEDFKK